MQVAIHTKTKEEFDKVLKMIRREVSPSYIKFNSSWDRLGEGTCIAWEKGKKYVYCSPHSFCSRYPKTFFTIDTFRLYLMKDIGRGLYYDGEVIKK